MNKKSIYNVFKKTSGLTIPLFALILATIAILLVATKSAAQIPSLFLPNFPSRLMYLSDAIANTSQELISPNQDMIDLVNECSCEFSQSQCKQIITNGQPSGCVTIGAIGKPCSLVSPGEETEPTIRSLQRKSRNLALDLSYLRKLLIKEKEAGLERQLETLRKDPSAGIDDAQDLRDAINIILGTSADYADGALSKVITKAEANLERPKQCSTNACTPHCGPGDSFSLSEYMCLPALTFELGEVKPTVINFHAGIEIEDWELGKIEITNVKLNLPESIDIPELPGLKMPSFSISVPEIKIDCPTKKQEISFQTPQPSLPKTPTMKLSCPTYNTTASYQYPSDLQPGSEKYREFEWFLETFSWLSGICMDAVWGDGDLPDSQKMQYPDKFNQSLTTCFDPFNVANKLIQECNEQYANYHPSNPPSGPPPVYPACEYWVNKQPAEFGSITEEHCFKFFEGFADPSGTQGWEDIDGNPATNDPKTFDPGTKDKIYDYLEQKYGITIDDEPQDQCRDKLDPLPTLIDSCNKLRELHPQKQAIEFPDQCKILPIFYNLPDYIPPHQIASPEVLELFAQSQLLSGQQMNDLPSKSISGCPSIGAPSIPKIPLSKYSIIIPDIKLPTFKLGPFFRIKLPSLIFEDLIFEDIELCNLDDCQFKFPNLNFEAPTLTIPQIDVPSIKLESFNVPGIPNDIGKGIEISISPMEFQPFDFDFSQLINLNSLVSPEFQTPDISLPKPKLTFGFEGLDIDFTSLLSGLFDFNLPPNPGLACLPEFWNIDGIPIAFDFPDYIFSWPAFPDIPEIPGCADAKKFCKDINGSIQKITEQAGEIQEVVNGTIQTEIQGVLNMFKNEIENQLTGAIESKLNDIATEIKKEIYNWIQSNAPPSTSLPSAPIPGVFPVADGLSCQGLPPLTIDLKDILGDLYINTIELEDYLPPGLNLEKISIPWPDELKNLDLSTINNPLCSDCKGLSYELPTVPLSGLKYEKSVPIELPGFQYPSPQINFGSPLPNATACVSQPPTGNACGAAPGDMQTDLTGSDGIQELSQKLNDASKKIRDVLQ
ncbi:MAG: hypothetical protein UR98_C0002G0041 [Parcubacteria group bacterium GW2011_GWA1_36_12]|nr:MAG: hypothetical protein UR98_C0002G0041 [Parcubacteria group bacterium GW2011_GWA1_36_12]